MNKSTSPLRLTCRGRILARSLLLFAGFVVALSGFGQVYAIASSDYTPRTVVVQPGDTLVGIAERYLPDRDSADAVRELRRVNHLDGARIYIGQQLRLH